MRSVKRTYGQPLLRAGFIGAYALGLFLSGGPPAPWVQGPVGVALAQTQDLSAEGLAAISAYMGALVSQDKAAIEAVLAPEFQAMRSEGGGYDRASYLSEGLPTIAEMPEITNLVVTHSEGLLVTRYTLLVEETTAGAARTFEAPRLTVFRKAGDVWLVVAHANFSRIES